MQWLLLLLLLLLLMLLLMLLLLLNGGLLSLLSSPVFIDRSISVNLTSVGDTVALVVHSLLAVLGSASGLRLGLHVLVNNFIPLFNAGVSNAIALECSLLAAGIGLAEHTRLLDTTTAHYLHIVVGACQLNAILRSEIHFPLAYILHSLLVVTL